MIVGVGERGRGFLEYLQVFEVGKRRKHVRIESGNVVLAQAQSVECAQVSERVVAEERDAIVVQVSETQTRHLRVNTKKHAKLSKLH